MVAEAEVVVRTEAEAVGAAVMRAAVADRTPPLTGLLLGRRLIAAGIGGIRSTAAARRRKRAAQGPE